MDSTKNDDKKVKEWYKTTHQFITDYHINAYPTFLFFSPEGKLMHKGIGYQPPFDFLKIAFDAMDRNRQEYVLLDIYRKGELSDWHIPELITLLTRADEKGAADSIALQYINNYLLKLPNVLLLKKANLALISSHLKRVDIPVFNWFYSHRHQIDSLAGRNYANTFLSKLIDEQEINPKLWIDAAKKSPIVQNPDWRAIHDDIAKRYDEQLTDESLMYPQIDWFKQHKQWPELINVEIKRIELLWLDTNGELMAQYADVVNTINYNYIVIHGTDQTVLKKAIKWQEEVLAHNPDPANIDTYADLLYKYGNHKEAIVQEQKAADIVRKQLETKKEDFKKINRDDDVARNDLRFFQDQLNVYEITLQKMKDETITWTK